MGQLYLSNIDFIKCGVPASIIAALVGYFHPYESGVLNLHF